MSNEGAEMLVSLFVLRHIRGGRYRQGIGRSRAWWSEPPGVGGHSAVAGKVGEPRVGGFSPPMLHYRFGYCRPWWLREPLPTCHCISEN